MKDRALRLEDGARRRRARLPSGFMNLPWRMMLKIGDFSKLANVTVKALRHYAEIGLLKPALIDRFTGYRYYTLEQLARLNRILALKDLGFSLDQIDELLNQDVSVEQLRGMLRLKQAELQNRLREEQNRLERVEARLRLMEGAGANYANEVVLKRVEALTFVSLRECVPTREALPGAAARMQRRLAHWLEAARLTPVEPWLALAHNPDYAEQNIDFELGVGLPAAARLPALERGEGGVRLRALPACEQAAALAATGPREALAEAYAALYAWIEFNHFRAVGAARELYLREPDETGARPELTSVLESRMIEVQIPVRPARTGQGDGGGNMQPKIVTRAAFWVAGAAYVGKNENNEIAAMWTDSMPQIEAIPSALPNVHYGVCRWVDDAGPGVFEYVAGVEVTEHTPLPAGMALRQVPALKYAVFEHHGSLEGLGETYGKIFGEWMAAAGLEQDESRLDMEVYNEDFIDEQAESILYIWVAVK